MENDLPNIIYPIPLSNGHVVTIHNLPNNLNKEDAEKISRVILALSVTESNHE